MQKALPSNWKIKKLGEVVKNDKFAIVDGPFGTQLYAKDYTEIGIPVIRIINITRDNKFNDHNLVFISEQKFKSLTRSAVFPGDILLAKTGATIGKVAIFDNYDKALISSSCAKISINPDIANNKWVLYYLSTQKGQTQIIGGSSGSTRNSINLKEIANVKIPLPPLPTQHKIVEILEEADSLRKLRQKGDEKMKDLIPSIFIQMFGDPARNPKGWEVKRLGEVSKIRRGASPRPMGDLRYFGGAIPWVRITDIHRNGKFLKETEDHVTEEGAKRSVYLKAGSLIMAMAASIGTPCFLAVDGCIHDGFVVFEDLSRYLDKEYLYHFILAFKDRFTSLAPEGTQKNLNTGLIKSVSIPLPPLPLQQEFAKLVKDIEAEKARQAESRKKLDELFQSLMQRAFTGELVA